MYDLIDGSEAVQVTRKNEYSDWSGAVSTDPGKPNSAANRIRSPFLKINPKFDLNFRLEDGLFAIGSCFAREIEAAFRRDHFNVLSFRSDLMNSNLFSGPRLSSAHEFLNRYNSASMLLEVERLLGKRLGRSLLSVRNDAVTDFHFANSCHPAGLDVVLERRKVTAEYGQGIRQAKIIILTLGVNEIWIDSENLPLNTHPDIQQARRPNSGYRFKVLSVDENLRNLETIYRLIKSHNPEANFVITVSPVPLQTTFTGTDIIEANQLAKSTLLIAARIFTSRHMDAHYFPSYEIVMYSDPIIAWKEDKKHVKPEVVNHIVRTFKESCMT